MQVEIFTIADYATTTMPPGGKLTIVNAFTTLWATEVPGHLAQCFVVVRVRFDDSEAGPHTINVRIIDADGKSLTSEPSLQKVHAAPNEMKTYQLTTLFEFRQVVFLSFGEYHLDLLLDNALSHRFPLYVMERKNP